VRNINQIFFILFFGINGFASEKLQKCLDSSVFHEHRIEKEENVMFCFDQVKNLIPKADCYFAIESHPNLINTYRLKLFTHNICFYDSKPHENLNTCLRDAARFGSATEHDNALFHCYQIFQEKASRKECLTVAKKMKFPAKKNYLENHCLKN
jgi:hypothetical protein